jgi:hypothetical protein
MSTCRVCGSEIDIVKALNIALTTLSVGHSGMDKQTLNEAVIEITKLRNELAKRPTHIFAKRKKAG